jgi:hypothetical protein
MINTGLRGFGTAKCLAGVIRYSQTAHRACADMHGNRRTPFETGGVVGAPFRLLVSPRWRSARLHFANFPPSSSAPKRPLMQVNECASNPAHNQPHHSNRIEEV